MSNLRDSGFSPVLLEKDFYLTVILFKLAELNHGLVFKGGTCLNKCYLGYYRLSEDLDFIHIQSGKRNRNGRKADFNEIEKLVYTVIAGLPGMTCGTVQKFDEHHQLRIDIHYESFFIDNASIKFEVTHRYPLYMEAETRSVQHMFRHPITNTPYRDSASILCISLEEAVAEKIRACLTRKNPAIRDFFDLWFIKYYSEMDLTGTSFIHLVQNKIKESSGIIDIDELYLILMKQIEEELKPTINKIYEFDLENIISFIQEVKNHL